MTQHTTAHSSSLAENPTADVFIQGASTPNADQKDLVQEAVVNELLGQEIVIRHYEGQELVNREIGDASKKSLESMLHVLRSLELFIEEIVKSFVPKLRSDDHAWRKVGKGEHLQHV